MKCGVNILFIILILISTSFQAIDQYEYLKNGRYKVKFDRDFSVYEDYELEIYGNTYTRWTKDGKEFKGSIDRISNDLFVMEDIKSQQDSLKTDNILAISFGKPCFEIESVHGSRIYFRTTYTGNLHVTINEGVFIRYK